jgi:hypothetical protein
MTTETQNTSIKWIPDGHPLEERIPNANHPWKSEDHGGQSEPICDLAHPDTQWSHCRKLSISVPDGWQVLETETFASRGPGCEFGSPHPPAHIEAGEKPSFTRFELTSGRADGHQVISRIVTNWATGTHAPYGSGVSFTFRVKVKSA